jgi:very-short-patch-repair endonuclease
MESRDFAKQLRQNLTDAERVLWGHLRAHRFQGQKFRRQQPLGPYILDFVHFGARLVIEADGGQHAESKRDAARDAWLASEGFRVLRFWNDQILKEAEAVLEVILQALAEACPLSPNLPSLRSGFGGHRLPPAANKRPPPLPTRGEGSNVREV